MSLVFPHHLRPLVPLGRAVHPRHRGKTFVVAIAGELIAAGKLNALRAGPARSCSDGHQARAGARLPAAGQRAAARQGPRGALLSHGMRITDAVALDCAQEAAGQLRFEIEAAFSQGLPNTPMANATVRVVSGNFLTARPVGIVDGVDFMHSGLVRKVDARGDPARASTSARMVLLSPFGFSPTGEAFNLTMEDVATSDRDRAAGRQADVRDRGAGHPRRRRDDPDSPIDTELALADAEAPARRAAARRSSPTDTAFYLQHCVQRLRGRRRALAHPAVRGRRRAAAGGLHARRHRHDGGRREAREPARGHAPTTSAASCS